MILSSSDVDDMYDQSAYFSSQERHLEKPKDGVEAPAKIAEREKYPKYKLNCMRSGLRRRSRRGRSTLKCHIKKL
jgi:hypothetical protein